LKRDNLSKDNLSAIWAAMFDMAKFLRTHWADERKLVTFLAVYGVKPPKRMTARKWYDRSSVPSEWFATLLMLLEIERGRPVSLIGFKRQ
jgi:hypothetical protein